ncbi:unnamed protein product [Cercospora beticola]|nr:unnamed protein product [Cercospora beticola]
MATISQAQLYKIPPAELVNTRCNDGKKLPTATYGGDGIIFTVCSERVLKASIAETYDALLDFSRYSEWNSFVVDVQPVDPKSLPPGPAPLETKVKFITQGLLGPFNSTSDEIVTIDIRNVDGKGKIAVNGWRYDGPGQLAEHLNILTDLGDGTIRYVSYESYYGLLAPVLALLLKKNLQKAFDAQGDDLKRYVEA